MGVSLDLEAFCIASYPKLVRMLFLYCGDRELARDVAQETMGRATAQWRKVRKMDHPEAWLHRVGVNQINSHFRRRAAETRASDRLSSGWEGIWTPPDTADAVAIRKALADLSPRQRLAILFRYFLDYSVDETADAMDCGPGTVKKLTRRALDTIRPQLAVPLEVSDE
jgi:RNA polymerase sigma factor (sigma-70 family)